MGLRLSGGIGPLRWSIPLRVKRRLPKTRRGKAGLWLILLIALLGIIGSVGGSNGNQPASNQAPLPVTTTAPVVKPSPAHSAHHVTPKATHKATPAPAKATPAPAVVTSQAPASCTPVTSGGHCYEPGEFCRKADHGMTGTAGDGKTITCEDNNGWRWED